MAVDPVHNIGIQMNRKDIYDDFKLTETLWSPWFMHKYVSALWVNLNSH